MRYECAQGHLHNIVHVQCCPATAAVTGNGMLGVVFPCPIVLSWCQTYMVWCALKQPIMTDSMCRMHTSACRPPLILMPLSQQLCPPQAMQCNLSAEPSQPKAIPATANSLSANFTLLTWHSAAKKVLSLTSLRRCLSWCARKKCRSAWIASRCVHNFLREAK